MAIIKILQYPDPRLKRIAPPIKSVDEHIRKIVDDMFETHYSAKNCAALAATQLDFKEAYRITVIDFSSKKNEPLCLINPEIIERDGVIKEAEGCMSIAGGIYEVVERSARIRVRALNREGKPIEFEADGFMSKCVQHELDHLNGLLFIDHLSKLKRFRIDNKLSKLRRQNRI